MKLRNLFPDHHARLKARIEKWMYSHVHNHRFQVSPDGFIHYLEDLQLVVNEPKLPDYIQFGRVMGDFKIEGPLTTMAGFPRHVQGSCRLGSNMLINSIEGMPERIGRDFDIENTHIDELHNIHKYCKSIGGSIIAKHLRSNILGTMLVEHLKSVHFDRHKAAQILNHHLLSEARDIHACQQELIDAGYPDLAKL